jgi:hypothetical protein
MLKKLNNLLIFSACCDAGSSTDCRRIMWEKYSRHPNIDKAGFKSFAVQ